MRREPQRAWTRRHGHGPARISVFIGTKSQYMKMAPVLRELDARRVPYWLIDTGQHARLAPSIRAEVGVREPDVQLGGPGDVNSASDAARWAARLLARSWSRDRVRAGVFAGSVGICVVHGDTPSTFVASTLARRAGLRIAHFEAGLRSRSYVHPFPEEAIRVAVSRSADLLFAVDQTSVSNLVGMGVRGRIVVLPGNPVLEQLGLDLGDEAIRSTGPTVMLIHRVENLLVPDRLRQVVRLAAVANTSRPVRFVLHPPTRRALARAGLLEPVSEVAEVTGLRPHGEFVRSLAHAPLVITDGGSVQEECAALGVPTLLWRARTERPDGLGANVVLSRYSMDLARRMIAEPEVWRRPRAEGLAVSPSEVAVAALVEAAYGAPASDAGNEPVAAAPVRQRRRS